MTRHSRPIIYIPFKISMVISGTDIAERWMASIHHERRTIMNDYEIIGEIALELCLILSFISLDEIMARKKGK